MVLKFFGISIEDTSKVFWDFWCMIKFLSGWTKYHPLTNFTICEKSGKTSEVTSEFMLKNFQIMKFWSDSESLCGFCGVSNVVYCCWRVEYLTLIVQINHHVNIESSFDVGDSFRWSQNMPTSLRLGLVTWPYMSWSTKSTIGPSLSGRKSDVVPMVKRGGHLQSVGAL